MDGCDLEPRHRLHKDQPGVSDLFHKDVPSAYIEKCFDVMVRAKQHTFQVLTKRPERAAEMALDLPWSVIQAGPLGWLMLTCLQDPASAKGRTASDF